MLHKQYQNLISSYFVLCWK